MKDSRGKDINLNDLVLYGVRSNSKSARGEMKIGKAIKIEGSYLTVDSSWARMIGSSATVVTPLFADMWNNRTVFDIT